MTDKSDVDAVVPRLSPTRRSPRKVTFPGEDGGDERYMASIANVSLRRRGSFAPSQLANIEEARLHQVRGR